MSKKVIATSYRELLMHREYLFVLVSSTLSSFAFVLFQVVLFWLAYKISETTFQAAVVVQSSAVPYLLFGLLGGVYADHWNKKKIIIWNQLGTGFMIFTILIMYWLHIESIWYIAVASFFIVSFRCFYSPAIRSLVSKTLPEALWPKGNSIFQLSLQLSRSIAPIFSGILLSFFSPEWMFFIFFILTIAPIGFVIPLILEHKKTSKSVPVIKELKETFTFLKTKNSLFYFDCFFWDRVIVLYRDGTFRSPDYFGSTMAKGSKRLFDYVDTFRYRKCSWSCFTGEN